MDHFSSISLKKYFEESHKTYEKNLNVCLIKVEEKAVHDCRVSLRRLMSALSTVAILTPAHVNQLSKYKRTLKKIQRKFSATRDSHVSHDYLNNRLPPDLNVDLSHLSLFFSSIISNNELQLSENLSEKDLENVSFIINHTFELTHDTLLTLHDLSCYYQSLNVSFLKVIEKLYHLDEKVIDTFHDIRIPLKNFRYQLEILQLLSPIYQDQLVKLKELQEYLGEIQDLAVLIAFLELFEKDESEAVNPILFSWIEERMITLSKNFYDQRFQLLSLWDVIN